jgi:hypothetical protein
MRTRSLSCQALALIHRRIGGIAEARLTTAPWPVNAAASADRSNSDTETAVAPCAVSTAAFSGVRASAVTM